jgi:hypothetical protein
MAMLAGRTGLKRLFNGFAAPAVAEAMPALTTSLRGFAAHAEPIEGLCLFTCFIFKISWFIKLYIHTDMVTMKSSLHFHILKTLL